ncbi:MAG: hypothetical protein ATN34_02400 [Epulopiscium sp. Nele67-Bin002]|nr:MAG: hypothetical protein BEN18_07825 [Epulopiscium sp. Nuni2H_MBin001]OON91175.1 MAG: hypothetical protein ATN34_02400 [Epulopiscium sp. Nele67-Bin002]OON91855.1 MAG: hypothetical protein ATN33_08465 [Epulopiscium sp. Nele67-Bin001]
MVHKDLHAPFYHKRRSNIGVLCIHGLFGSPNQFWDVATVIGNLGYDCNCILLPGHGGSCRSFGKSSYRQWKDYAREQINLMRKHYDKLYLVGHSMGSLFCLDFADEMHVDGIILINTPMKIYVTVPKMMQCVGVVFDTKTTTELSEYFGSGRGRPVYSVDNGKWYEYIAWIVPMVGIYRLIFETKRNLPKVKTKTLIFQSQKDDTVNYKSIYYFAKKMVNKKIIVLKESNHSYFTPHDLKVLQKNILNFMK